MDEPFCPNTVWQTADAKSSREPGIALKGWGEGYLMLAFRKVPSGSSEKRRIRREQPLIEAADSQAISLLILCRKGLTCFFS